MAAHLLAQQGDEAELHAEHLHMQACRAFKKEAKKARLQREALRAAEKKCDKEAEIAALKWKALRKQAKARNHGHARAPDDAVCVYDDYSYTYAGSSEEDERDQKQGPPGAKPKIAPAPERRMERPEKAAVAAAVATTGVRRDACRGASREAHGMPRQGRSRGRSRDNQREAQRMQRRGRSPELRSRRECGRPSARSSAETRDRNRDCRRPTRRHSYEDKSEQRRSRSRRDMHSRKCTAEQRRSRSRGMHRPSSRCSPQRKYQERRPQSRSESRHRSRESRSPTGRPSYEESARQTDRNRCLPGGKGQWISGRQSVNSIIAQYVVTPDVSVQDMEVLLQKTPAHVIVILLDGCDDGEDQSKLLGKVTQAINRSGGQFGGLCSWRRSRFHRCMFTGGAVLTSKAHVSEPTQFVSMHRESRARYDGFRFDTIDNSNNPLATLTIGVYRAPKQEADGDKEFMQKIAVAINETRVKCLIGLFNDQQCEQIEMLVATAAREKASPTRIFFQPWDTRTPQSCPKAQGSEEAAVAALDVQQDAAVAARWKVNQNNVPYFTVIPAYIIVFDIEQDSPQNKHSNTTSQRVIK